MDHNAAHATRAFACGQEQWLGLPRLSLALIVAEALGASCDSPRAAAYSTFFRYPTR